VGLISRALLLVAPRRSVREAFTRHYERRDWDEPESASGRGSSFKATAAIRTALPSLFQELGVRSVVDAGCGDFNWFRQLPTELDSYLGIEVVPQLAELNERRYATEGRHFASLDLIRDPIPRADLIFCRDCLVHLKNSQVLGAIRNFQRSQSTYLLATTFTEPRPNRDIPLGGWRPLNLERAPFELGRPLRLISEADSVEDPKYADKSLGLWALQSLRP
jgi:hypothetical protein